jgi:hypothetical protein
LCARSQNTTIQKIYNKNDGFHANRLVQGYKATSKTRETCQWGKATKKERGRKREKDAYHPLDNDTSNPNLLHKEPE